MVRMENDCVGCPQGCVAYCQLRNVPHYYCDVCGGEVDPDELHENTLDGGHICMDCIVDRYPKISV